ncbi:MAG TPA: GAF domain-containing protein [Thermoplasmata archaeon]|nr:GAF domain-containing protein [Thermoplasmata archaeon]
MTLTEEISETQILAALLGIAGMVGDLTDTREMLESVVRIAPSLVRVDRCAVLTLDESSREFRSWVSFGPGSSGTPFDGLRIPEAEMPRLAHRLLVLRLPALVKADSKDFALPPGVVKRLGLRAALLVPLVARGRVLGLLWLDHSAQSHYFTSKEINVIQGIATSVAVALDGASRLESLEIERRRFEALARSLADGVISLGPDLRILEMDRGAEDLLGWQSSEVRGRRVHEVFAISEAEAGMGWTREGHAPAPAPKQLQVRARNGALISCMIHAAPVRNVTGETFQVLYVLKAAQGTPVTPPNRPRPQIRAQRVAPPE